MTHPFNRIDIPDGGALLMTPCPGTKDATIAESMQVLYQAGAVALITLMQPEEQARYGVSNLQAMAEAHGLAWFEWPIDDDEQPTGVFETRWEAQKSDIVNWLKQGKTVALHCKGGQGRTSLVSALLMLELGYDWLDIKARIQAVKPRALVIEKHLAYLQQSIRR